MSTSILKSINNLGKRNINLHLRDILNKKRLEDSLVAIEQLSFDYSKQRITSESLQELLEIPDLINLKKSIELLSEGEFINHTEDKSVSHMLYRRKTLIDNDDFIGISLQKNKLKDFILRLTENITPKLDTIICLGIGGSRLGSQLLTEAFGQKGSSINIYYCSSYDLVELEEAMASADPLTSLVIVASKSFNTPEVIDNLNKANEWLGVPLNQAKQDKIFAISSNTQAMEDVGISKSNQFTILDTLGGRNSIWSSMSLPAIFNMGWNSFEEFLEGANLADNHFLTTPWHRNIPVLMALFSAWNLNGLKINNLGIFTYDYRIRSLTNYLAQMGMESNGKTYNHKSVKTEFNSSPLIWGGYGPESQHSVFQWLLQGKGFSACDFIAIDPEEGHLKSYEMMLSQIVALSMGKEVEQKYKTVFGNNPISLIQLPNMNPKNLGFMLAIYEHKIFVESQIYGVDPYDQWGVEFTKNLSLNSRQDRNFMSKYFSNQLIS